MRRGICRIVLGLALLAVAPLDGGTKAMDSVSVEQLGEVAPFRDTGSWLKSKGVEPTPIILWRGADIAAALFYQWKGNSILSSFEQKIASMERSPRVALGPAYPLRYSGRVSADRGEEALPAFDVDHALAADLDGDGTDELVLPRHLGAVEVYDLRRRLHSGGVPGTDPRSFSYEVVSAQKVRAGDKDRVYFVFHRAAYKGTKAPKAEGSPPADTIVEVSDAGVRVISLLGLPSVPVQVAGLGLKNRPGSTHIDELVLLLRFQDREGLFLSQHDLQGKARGEPRLVYADVSGQQRFSFTFLPQSDLLVATGDSSELAAFFWPDKPVNWVKTVKVDPKLGGQPLVRGFLGPASGRPKALVQAENRLYAIDAEGAYWASIGGVYSASPTPVPWADIATASPKHRIAQVRPLDGDSDRVLVIDACDEHERELELEEAREAAAKFLPPEFVAKVEKANAPSWKTVYDEALVRGFARKHGITEPITTLEDIGRLLPDLYELQLTSLEADLSVALECELKRPLHDADVGIAEPRYRNLEDYKAWLGTVVVSPQTRLRLIEPGGVVRSDHTLTHTALFRLGPAPGIPPSWVSVKLHASGLRLVVPLERSAGGTVSVGFFSVSTD